MIILLLIVLVNILVLFLWSACKLSSRISREEERNEKNK